MKNSKKLLVISILALLSSCTEEVAEELKNSKSSQTTTTETKSLRLKHDMDSKLSFYLHQGGAGDQPCELKEPTGGFDADDYTRSSSVYTQDCVLEVQELDLYHNGAAFTFEASADMCEYYSYTPLRFFEQPIGDTQKTVYEIACENDECSSLCGTTWEEFDDGSGPNSGSTTAHLSGQIIEAPTCNYDYTETPYRENCDEGDITTITLELDDLHDHDGDPTTDEVCRAALPFSAVAVDSVTTECGGDHLNCLGGPAKDFFEGSTATTRIYGNLDLSAISESFEVEAPTARDFETGRSDNRYLASFSRYMANENTCEPDSSFDWNTFFEGDNLEMFNTTAYSPVLSKTLNVNRVGTEQNLASGLAEERAIDAVAWAENPFRSVYSTSAYYSFKCLDAAYDVKAQIRLHIREWDREYPTNSEAVMQYISDYDALTQYIDSSQSNIDGTPWNNITDWDDFFSLNNVFDNTPGSCLETVNYFNANGGTNPFPQKRF